MGWNESATAHMAAAPVKAAVTAHVTATTAPSMTAAATATLRKRGDRTHEPHRY